MLRNINTAKLFSLPNKTTFFYSQGLYLLKAQANFFQNYYECYPFYYSTQILTKLKDY